MDNTILKIIVALFAMILTPIGFLIGNVRYKKYKDELWEQMEREDKYMNRHSIFYKRPYQRVFARTFGTPVIICYIIGLILLYCVFNLI